MLFIVILRCAGHTSRTSWQHPCSHATRSDWLQGVRPPVRAHCQSRLPHEPSCGGAHCSRGLNATGTAAVSALNSEHSLSTCHRLGRTEAAAYGTTYGTCQRYKVLLVLRRPTLPIVVRKHVRISTHLAAVSVLRERPTNVQRLSQGEDSSAVYLLVLVRCRFWFHEQNVKIQHVFNAESICGGQPLHENYWSAVIRLRMLFSFC